MVRGIVQGVGFRPYIYQLARRLELSGYVLNTSSGVMIEVQGAEADLDRFFLEMRRDPPPLARIDEIACDVLPVAADKTFTIRESAPQAGQFALIPPDVGLCDSCASEIQNSSNRRSEYAFTNCTDCGPRYSIIQDVPYDRQQTTMALFTMCPDCQREYLDPSDRRFHAQPNACATCGPKLCTLNKDGSAASIQINEVRDLLARGLIVALKGLGGFQFACDARNESAVSRLRAGKKRSNKPFALMVREIAAAETICYLTTADRELLCGPERPIVLLRRRAGCGVAPSVAPGVSTLGVMLPATALHLLLFAPESELAFAPLASTPEVLVVTSGNISDEPIVTDNAAARQKLGGIADLVAAHNRDIHARVDDSVARTFEGVPRLLRRARGYAPRPIDLACPIEELLACGADLKNTFCLTRDCYAILSQHIGDIDNYETLQFFEESLRHLKKLFLISPRAVACDLHPAYITRQFATEMGLPVIPIQHHQAHIASCMAENRLQGNVIGVAFDGTGYGSDGRIWGGEFFTGAPGCFTRRAHLLYVPVAGGDAAVRQPWRAALGWLNETYGDSIPEGLPMDSELGDHERSGVLAMLRRGINTIHTSSCGRLFDAVASLLGVCQEATYEGQAAVELESMADEDRAASFPFDLIETEPWQLDFRPTVEAIVDAIRDGQAAGHIAGCFHNTLAVAIAEVCRRLRRSDGLKRVCLSGGVFQNQLLLSSVVRRLRHAEFEVFAHSQVPPNDGGICLGQAVIANEILLSGVL